MLNEKQFDAILSVRRYEPPSANLADRIIAAARNREVLQEQGFISYLAGIVGSVIPHPVYAVALVIIVGLVIGITAPLMDDEQQMVINIEEEGTL